MRDDTRRAFACVTTLFFAWGAITSVNDVLIPAVKSIFQLSDTESFLTQFAFFMAYGIVSLPAAMLLARIGSASAILIALGVMLGGCLMIPLATIAGSYPMVLAALFVIASGITLLQVAANPLAAVLGPSDKSHFRLVLSQAFNSLGTVIAPYLAAHTLLQGGLFEPGGSGTAEEKLAESLGRLELAYGFIAAAILALMLLFYRERHRIAALTPAGDGRPDIMLAFRSRWALPGAGAIFLYVGAEVAIGSIMVNFLEQRDIFAISAADAGKLVSLYWLGAMIGRFIGSALLVRFAASKLLTLVAVCAALFCVAVSGSTGTFAGVLALSIGLFNAIMFPVIFTLTIERSTAPASATSGLLCMAIVGGALVPLLFAVVADASSRSLAFLVPAACYVLIAGFAIAAGRARTVARSGDMPVAAH